eukprot:CAMPEP_0115004286 /NCGR_PEP_ID=MMETSP0216-20121206/19105_1 /TAXON_ID=223996 /ORGANISM="Protocruzia adherens, Strain Boccale" /LENGTH=256 /DNA_ID=CAMNT_0002370231 /DNA_START=27 /DNA_END=797 /DNA_ORIENTATION=-
MDYVLWIFTLGYLAQSFASGILIYKIQKTKSIDGLSIDTQLLFLVGALSRCVWVWDTRLTSIFLIWFELVCAVILSIYIIFLCRKYAYTAIIKVDGPLQWPYILAGCLILCFFFHPGSKNDYYVTIQMLVSLSMFLEAAGLMPQLYLMRKIGEVEGLTSHYIFALGVARFLRLIFWVSMYMQGETFIYLILADLLHTILLADFTYYYFRSIKSGTPLLITDMPTTTSSTSSWHSAPTPQTRNPNYIGGGAPDYKLK